MRPDLLIDQLAELAGQRNQDALDACFLDLFQDLLEPRSVAIYRIAGNELVPRWSFQRRGLPGDDPSQPDPGRRLLPALPMHLEAWQTGQIRQLDAVPALTVIPMGGQQATECLVEICTEQPLGAVEQRLLTGVQRFHRHLRALVDENERDSLTRLLNRKSFDGTFGRMALDRVEAPEDGECYDGDRRLQNRVPRRCWLAVLDIDHFKRVNDVHGHLVGDEVLIVVAQLLRTAFRGADRLYRFGGEEFVVLLHSPGAVAATVAFERMRRSVEDYPFPHVGRITISVGFTEVRSDDTPMSAFERADRAVYHAKSNGRNQIACHEELVNGRKSSARNLLTQMGWA